jgi:hypothetical protein
MSRRTGVSTQDSPFPLRCLDLRFQKAIEARQKQDRETTGQISDEASPLNEMFRAPKVDRPAIPLYIQDLRADRHASFDPAMNRVRPKCMDINAAGALFKERIVRQ